MNSKLSPRLIVVIIVASIVSVLVAHYQDFLPYQWQTYRAADNSFSIELPGTPSVKTTQVPLEGGGTATATLVSAKTADETAYSCAYSDHEHIGDKTPEQTLESARDGSLHKIQGTLITEQQTTVQGFPAIEMQARAIGNTQVDAQFVAAGDRLYMLMAVSLDGRREPKTIRRMFSSFTLNKR